jgi:GT2 family glycosyltransferase/glycosyltransferase involved in cell wall biosynthesis
VAKCFQPHWYARRRFGDPARTGQSLPEEDPGRLLDDYINVGAALDLPPHPLFDPAWYRAQLATVPEDELLIEHYLTSGRALSPHPCFDPASPAGQAAPDDRNPLLYYLKNRETWTLAPNALFDGGRYLDANPDVAAAGSHPLLHYLRAGHREGRPGVQRLDVNIYRSLAGGVAARRAMVDFLRAHRPPVVGAEAADLAQVTEPAAVGAAFEDARWAYTAAAVRRRAKLYALIGPLFHPSWYARQRFGSDDAGRPKSDPALGGTLLDDYLLRGAAMGLSPHPLFDPAWYATQVPLLPDGQLAIEHYLTVGGALSPHPAFDPASPASKAAPDGQNPLLHYVTHPETWELAPNDVFDGAYYASTYPDVVLAGINPLAHYITHGAAERRVPSADFDSKAYRTLTGLPQTTNAMVHYLRQRAETAIPDAAGIAFPEIADPLVSIVIPVYGHWAHTRACLLSLAAADPDPTFEVIVVDDAGPDFTADLLAEAPGVRVLRHQTNTGYVGACNTGIAAARGRYVALLNNDTRVSPDWLAPLVETIEDDGVGLVGAKLIYPDGRLQEAGGIIFSDASGFNYGKFGNVAASQYDYRRSVDYCSGAAILVRKEILDQLGGLDEAFAPAYYDDTDLAFAVRSLGLDVVYQPRSVVIHDEGVSHGTDETTGVKAFQVVNREKFRAKWATALARQRPPGPDQVERAARAHQGRDLVVVVDHYVPRPDQDSGSVRMLALLQELRRQGHGVVFVPANAMLSDRYGEALTAMGIEVAHGQHDWAEFFTALHGSVAAAIVSRVSIALGFAPVLRAALPGVPLIFDTVDLHFLRLTRETAIAPTPGAAAVTTLTREMELALIRSADTTLVVSQVEKDLLAELEPDADIRILSNVHKPLDDAAIPPLADRDGLVFVGSFAHKPNADAVAWFIAEVLPLIRRRLPTASLRIVGADPPPDLVAAAPAGVEYLGWVEDLAPVYGQSRIAIAPLRYGAGVKGKIGEAMAFGVPVVTTAVGAEGMSLRDGQNASVADTAADFSAAIVHLVEDDELWQRLSRAGREHIDQVLGQAQFSATVRKLIPEPPPVRE